MCRVAKEAKATLEMGTERPLQAMSVAFGELAEEVKKGPNGSLNVASFSNACGLISVLFGCLGPAFKFAEKDYVSKVKDLGDASKQFDSLPALVDSDVSSGTVRLGGSHTRNMLRVIRGVEMVRILFQGILCTDGNSLRDPASKAYNRVFAPHHGWAIRTAVSAGMLILPSKTQFLSKLHETEASARQLMESFVVSGGPVVENVHELFTSRELGIDW